MTDLMKALLPPGVSEEWLEGYRKEVIHLERERCIDRALAWWAVTPDLDAIPTDVAAEGIRAAIEERHPDLDLNPQP